MDQQLEQTAGVVVGDFELCVDLSLHISHVQTGDCCRMNQAIKPRVDTGFYCPIWRSVAYVCHLLKSSLLDVSTVHFKGDGLYFKYLKRKVKHATCQYWEPTTPKEDKTQIKASEIYCKFRKCCHKLLSGASVFAYQLVFVPRFYSRLFS